MRDIVKCVVFTMVKNEKVRLSIWLRYYSKFFDKKDIYILDHESSDNSIEKSKYNVVEIVKDSYDPEWRRDIIVNFQKNLFESYDLVLYTDIDEIVAPDPEKYMDLRDYIDKFQKNCINCTGYELFHLKSLEPPLDFEKPIFIQRLFFYRNKIYDKPLLAKIPLHWTVGFHSAQNCRETDSDLYLFHLHRMDYEFCKMHTLKQSEHKWSKGAIQKRLSWQNRLIGSNFDRWFSNLSEASSPLELIPEKFKNIV